MKYYNENSPNIGRIIKDPYCDGYFGRDFDIDNSEIIAEGNEYIVIRKPDGIVDFCNFQSYTWNRNNNGTLAGGISNLKCLSQQEKQKLIDGWCE